MAKPEPNSKRKEGSMTKQGDNQMKRQNFYIICNELLISPLIALENENIVQALKDRNDEKVKELLKEEF